MGQKLSIRDRLIGGVLGLVVGDALGVPVEFFSREEMRRKPVKGMIGPGTHHQPPGTWSDDSSLALATLESLLGGYNPRDIMERFRRWRYDRYMTARGAVFDVGVTTQTAITRYSEGRPQKEWGGARESDNGNGSLMRILPLSLYLHRLEPDAIIERSGEISALTHAHVRARLCCAYYSLLLKGVLEGKDLRSAMACASQQLLPSVPPDEKKVFEGVLTGAVLHRPEDEITTAAYVLDTLEASLWCCGRYPDYEHAVLAAVNLGSDTDTTAAVTGGLAGALYGRQGIPQTWIGVLARADEVQKLAESFADKILAELPRLN